MGKKILIVDDEADIRDSLKTLVEKQGYSAETAENGNDALQKLGSGSYDLVLLDMFMPELSGRQVLEKIRGNPKLKNQKVAFVTVAKLSEAGHEKISALEPAEYFTKPIDINDFASRLKKLLK